MKSKMTILILISLFQLIYSQTVPVTLHYKPIYNEFTTLRLVGNFNGWNNADPNMIMTDNDGDGEFEITKEFAIGVEHMYKFVMDANWSFAWNDPDNPSIKLTDNDNSILNVTDPFITYLLPRGVNSAGNMYVDTTQFGEPIRAIFAFTDANPINLNTLNVKIDGIAVDNPSQYYIEEKKEFFYHPVVPLGEGEHTVSVSISSNAGTATKTSKFKRLPGLIVYKIPVDFYFDEFNTGSSIIQNINSVSLVGDFNNWNESFNRMNDENGDKLWETTALLEAGIYEYKFKLNNSIWINDPDEPIFSLNNDNNSFVVYADSTPTIKLLKPNEGTIYSNSENEITFQVLLRPGVKSAGVDESSIIVKLDNVVVPSTYDKDSSILTSSIKLIGEGLHYISVEFSNKNGLSKKEIFTYAVYTQNSGYFYADAINDEFFSYPSGVEEGSTDILSVLIDKVETNDSLLFDISLLNISERTRIGLIITNPTTAKTEDPLSLDIITEDWNNEGVFIPIGSPGNSFQTIKENKFWINRDPEEIVSEEIIIDSDELNNNKFRFTVSIAFLDSLLGSWTRERNIYLFSYLASENLDGNGYEVTLEDGGIDATQDPDIYDAAFFRSGFWQNRVFANYIPSENRMGPRFVSLNGFGRGKVALNAADISDSLVTFGPAITFLTPGVSYWFPNVNVKGVLSDLLINSLTFNLNGEESQQSVTDGIFNVPVFLDEGVNTVFVKAVNNKNYESISKNLILTYVKDHNPSLKVSGTVSGRVATLTAEGKSPDNLAITYFWMDDPINPARLSISQTGQTVNITIPTKDGEYYFNTRARDSEGRTIWTRTLIFAYGDSVHLAELNDHAKWIDNAIVYEIYPRSFSSKGNFEGIKEKISYMLDLGINTVWLMPIYKGPSIHGYEITDYYDFEEDYGSKEDFNDLVKTLHDAGIKIILDFVVNHTSIQHPFMQNVLEFKENSPWANFYIWEGEPGNSNYQFYFDWASLPNLNHNNIDVRKYFIEVAKYWVNQFNIDGYRCDVAWGVEERNSDFWQEWRTALKNIKPEVLLEAEASSSQNIFYQNRFDSANDWDLRNKIIGATNGTISIIELDEELRKNYPTYAKPFRFVENHDEVRVASSHDAQRSKLMHTIIMMANGIPLIYSGGEVGELTNRGLIDWSDPDSVKWYFKSLINIRKKYLVNPTLEKISTSEPSDVYAFISTSKENNLLTVANFKNENKNFGIYIGDLPEGTKYLTNLIDGQVIDIQPISDPIFIDLNPYEAKVFYLGEVPVGVEESETENIIIDEFKLYQNYPNPFNPTTKIKYSLPKTSNVQITIYDIMGREVKSFGLNSQTAGTYEIEWNGTNNNGSLVSSGIYLLQFNAVSFKNNKSYNRTAKLMLVK